MIKLENKNFSSVDLSSSKVVNINSYEERKL